MVRKLVQGLKENKGMAIVSLVFLTIYSLICFVNHYNYRTYALDLGAYTRAVYDYAHFHASYGEVFRTQPENILSDHFDLLLMIFSPLWWIFGELTLLVVQLAAIICGGWGAYRLAQQYGIKKPTATLVAACFLAYFGVFSAVNFDYHSSVVAASALPWFVLFFRQGKFRSAITAFIFILIAKENMGLWLFFICTALAWMHRKETKFKRTSITLSLVAILFFAWAIFFVMPFFSQQKQYSHIEFHVLGNNFSEIAKSIFLHPINAVALLFKNHLPDTALDHIKAETWVFWLLSGGFLMIVRPAFLWMMLPVMMQKMYHDDPAKWSVAQHYNIEFAPLVVWTLVEVIAAWSEKKQKWLAWSTLVCCVAVTIRLCDNTIAFVDKTRIRFYQADHYKCDFSKEDVRWAMAQIPAPARVSAQSMFVPHLISKEAVYQYPITGKAEYILLSNDIHSWPLDTATLKKRIDSLKTAPNVSTVCVKNGIYLFKIQANAVY